MRSSARIGDQDKLGIRRQLLLASYWFSLSFQAGAVFDVAEYYVRDVLRVTQFVQGAAITAGGATFTAVFGGVVAGILLDRIGRRLLVTGASVLMASALAVLAFVHQLDVVLLMGVVFGIALGTFSAVDWALAIDVLPDQNFVAKDLGLWGISTTLPQTVAPLIGGRVLGLLTPIGESFRFAVLFLGAAISAAASGVLVWRLQRVR